MSITRFLLPLLLLGSATAGAQPLATFMTAPPPEVIPYANRGGQELVLNTFRPAGLKPGETRPAIVWIHGGAWIGGNTDGFMPLARYFASRGMVAFNITYRLAKPGETGVGDCIADCRSAVRYIRAHAAELGVDPNRIAVIGDSAGGHLAAALGTLPGFDHPDDDVKISSRPDVKILCNPVLDLKEDDWIRFAVGGPALADRKTTPRPDSPEAVATARALSPIDHVAPGQPPALILHGRADHVVPLSQAERFLAAARAAGNRCELIVLEDNIGHAFIIAGYRWPESVVVDAVRRVDEFLAALGWIQGPPTLTTSNPPAWATPTPKKK